MKYFIVADVHGFYYEMRRALKAAGFDQNNPEHIFVSLGDAFDRGDYPKKVLNFMMSLPKNRRILIRGNHEDLMEDAITRRAFMYYDLTNGTQRTAFLLTGKYGEFDMLDDLRRHRLYNAYIANCVDYHETAHGIFVHGWIPHNVYTKGFSGSYLRHGYVEEWRNADRKHWEAARWYNGMESWADGIREPGKTIFCGHWHTSWARAYIDGICKEWSDDPACYDAWENKGIVALDACTAWSGAVNCYVFEDEPLPGAIN